MRLVFDIESDGLLETVSKIHCLNVIERETGRELRFTDHEYYQNVDGSRSAKRTPRAGTIRDGLEMLAAADEVAGQNILNYDIPALEKVYVDWKLPRRVRRVDTKVLSYTIYPTLKDMDFAAIRKGRLPISFQEKALIGNHSLEAWAIRIGRKLKGDFKPEKYGHTWATIPFIEDMDEYCMDDVRATLVVLEHFEGKGYAPQAIQLELDVARIIGRQCRYGVMFDRTKAEALVLELQKRKLELADQLVATFKPWYMRDGKKEVVKKTMRRFVEHPAGAVVRTFKGQQQRGWYEYRNEGSEFQKIKLVDFNPASRAHIGDRMIKLFGWEPEEYGKDGKPKVDEETLKSLPYPEAKLCVEYLTVDKRLGQIAEGKEAWLKLVKPDGRIYHSVHPMGAITSRMTHSNPNLAQVPRVSTPWGHECRELFCVPEGKSMVGCDADGLEGRMLAHYLYPFDGGAFMRTLLEGKKEDGTDLHTRNQKALQFNSRDNGKTFFYAMLYGAQGYTLGLTVVDDMTEERRRRFFEKYPSGDKRRDAIARLGTRAKARLIQGIVGLDRLLAKVEEKARRGWLGGLDGRRIPVRSMHAALNTLLQGNGAIVMKQAQVILDDTLQDMGFIPGMDYEFLLTVHDEWQLEVDTAIADTVGRVAADSIRRAGEVLRLRCPLAGNYDIGRNWAETH